MTDRLCIHKTKLTGDGGKVRLSADDLLSCCSNCGMGCNGGFPSQAWKFWKEKGLVSGGLYGTTDVCRSYEIPPCEHHVNGTRPPCNYDAHTPKCKKVCQKGYNVSYLHDKHYGECTNKVLLYFSRIFFNKASGSIRISLPLGDWTKQWTNCPSKRNG